MGYTLYSKIAEPTDMDVVGRFSEYRHAHQRMLTMQYGRIDHGTTNVVVKMRHRLVYRDVAIIHSGNAMKGDSSDVSEAIVHAHELVDYMVQTGNYRMYSALAKYDPKRPVFYPLSDEFRKAVSAATSITNQ